MASTYNFSYFNVTFPKEGIAHVEINRPKQLNAFFQEMWINYRDIMNRLAEDPNCRVIVLSGAGDRAFTSGLDVQKATILGGDGDEKDPARKAREFQKTIYEFQDCISSAERSLKPVISVLHGYSFGLAIDMTCATDIRVCAADTKFSIKEVDIGLAADIGTLSRMPKIVGNMSWIKEVALSARIWGAEEALKVGYVSRVFKDKKEALEGAFAMAELIAGKSPVAVQGTKELLNYSVDHPVAEGLKYTAIWNSSALQTSDVLTSIQAGMAKQKPRFEKL